LLHVRSKKKKGKSEGRERSGSSLPRHQRRTLLHEGVGGKLGAGPIVEVGGVRENVRGKISLWQKERRGREEKRKKSFQGGPKSKLSNIEGVNRKGSSNGASRGEREVISKVSREKGTFPGKAFGEKNHAPEVTLDEKRGNFSVWREMTCCNKQTARGKIFLGE